MCISYCVLIITTVCIISQVAALCCKTKVIGEQKDLPLQNAITWNSSPFKLKAIAYSFRNYKKRKDYR